MTGATSFVTVWPGALVRLKGAAETEGQFADRLLFYSKPKRLIIDALGHLPFERRRSASLLSARGQR